MRTTLPWNAISRRLTLLFLAVVILPAATLVWLGKQLLDQERALWAQGDLERRQATAGTVARSLNQSLSEAEQWLSGGTVPDGALRITISLSEVRIDPPRRALWTPLPPKLPQADAESFSDLEKVEFQGFPLRALPLYQQRAESPIAAVRAGALLRVARVYRNTGHGAEALLAYRKLAAISQVAIDYAPADLAARRAICSLLLESGRKADAAAEAASLDADFRAGRWTLDRPAWELTAGQIADWTGGPPSFPAERRALSEAADWFWQQRSSLEPSGRRMITASVLPMTMIWRTAGAEMAAVAIAPSVVSTWQSAAVRNLDNPAAVSLIPQSGGLLPAGGAVRLAPSETGLPWTVVVGSGDASRLDLKLSARRRLLSVGLGALVLLLAGAGYLLWRVVRRELAVARLQADFVAAVSHEFRTPLTSLRHITELLEEDDELPAERRRAFYTALGRSTERLHRLVETLLDFARMEGGNKLLDLQPVDASEITAQVVTDFQKEVGPRGFRVDLEVPPVRSFALQADPGALTHSLRNLLDNAIKYSLEDREVAVSVRAHPAGVAIAVQDHGIGIPPAERKEIFRKFVRGRRAKSLGIKGTGLGLAMVSQIVSAHRGTIELESEEGRGSTFRLVLPARG